MITLLVLLPQNYWISRFLQYVIELVLGAINPIRLPGEIWILIHLSFILDKVPNALTQVAFGVGDLNGNPDLWRMFSYCRENRVISNITINGRELNMALARRLTSNCGAVAVSHYDDEECFNLWILITLEIL
jgi:hypothetical protein